MHPHTGPDKDTGICRSSNHVVGLLDLPVEVLHIILSLLDPLSLASIYLVCQALRKAASAGRQRVTIQFDGCYAATAIASPRVLQLMHLYQSQLESLDAEEAEENPGPAEVPKRSCHRQMHRWLQAHLLASVAQEVVTLELWTSEQTADGETQVAVLENFSKPHRLVADMVQLESLTIRTGCGRAIIHELPSLQQLKRLILQTASMQTDAELICRLPSLTELDLGYADLDADSTRLLVGLLTSGRSPNLQKLGVTLDEESLCSLSALTTLTSFIALHVRMRKPSLADLRGIACLTGLKNLGVCGAHNYIEVPAIAGTLALLSSLAGLTTLELTNGKACHHAVPSDVSVLSSLTALRVLRCGMFGAAKFVAGDPFPVQMRFLRSATALEELELGFCASFWLVPDDSSRAMRAAVSTLRDLKRVKLMMTIPDEVDHAAGLYYAPLAVFAANSSIETLFA